MAVAAVALLAVILVLVTAPGQVPARPSAKSSGPGSGPGSAHRPIACQSSFVPAFFSPGSEWTRAIGSRPPPAVMILDITGTGAGTAPDPGLQSEASRAEAAGVNVIGYSATDYGRRPAAEIEADVRNYKAWYGVNGILLDLAAEGAAQLGYYRGLAGYIRQVIAGATVWLNPGTYPDQRYLAFTDVVMVFEGPFASYRQEQVPSWAYRYSAAKFAHTVFATSGSQMASAIRLSRSRNVGHVYVTDHAGANPYDGVPSYWAREVAAVTAGCAH
jgi:spherulation-specific family 4 protein